MALRYVLQIVTGKQGGLSFREEKMFLNEHHDIINMKNNLIDMLGRLNDAIEEEVDDEDR